MRQSPLVNSIYFLDPLPGFPTCTHSILEKGNQSHETGELNNSNLGPGQLALDTRGEFHGQ